MPTTRPRHAITETEDISAALAVAARRWPQDRHHPTRLLRHLVAAGAVAVDEESRIDITQRRELILELAGSMRGVYEPGYLEALRSEWPE